VCASCCRFLLLLALIAGAAQGAEFQRLRLSDGTELDYALALPAGFRKDREYPALVAFAGGRQNEESVRSALARYWETEALRRGYLVFSPVAPAGRPFYESGAELIPEFLRRQLAAFRIAGDKFHLAGSSNGAVSAFAVAVRHPELFHSLTALAGFPVDAADFERLERLRPLRIALFVGDGDLYWKEGMQKTRERLAALGKETYFEIIARNGHFLPDLSFERSARLFDSAGL
jgi:pimeloyl-ACP methyl ester carboxylesterase